MRLFRDSARWLFFAALILAPCFYGGTTKESIVWINCSLAVALGLWLIGLLFRVGKTTGVSVSNYGGEDEPRAARLLRVLAAASIAILVLGWWMVLNAAWIFDSEFFLFIPVQRLFPHAPGSGDYAISAAWMLRTTLLIGAMWLVVDLSQDPKWLLRLWWTIGIAGALIALLGLLQKATNANMIFWQPELPWKGKNFFATYYYRGNAGAFLNLVWPLIVGLAIRAFQNRKATGTRPLWLSLSVIGIVAAASNTSRMAHFVAVLSGVVFGMIFAPKILRDISRTERSIALVGAVVILLTMFAVAEASHFDQATKRWQGSWGSWQENGRWLAPRAATHALVDVGLLGLGPGTFRIIFPYYTADIGQRIHGEWRFLHEDYLQTLLEWGWLGAGLWAVVFFGAIIVGLRSYWRCCGRLATGRVRPTGGHGRRYSAEWIPRRRLILSLVILSLCGVATHALIDFPLQIMSIQLYVATYIGICWGSACWRDHLRVETETP